MAFDTEVFSGKNLSDMFRDVYANTDKKREQIDAFVSKFVMLIRTPEDAAVLGPVIKDFLDVKVKNDEHIVRLVQIAQRLVAINTKSDDSGLLTEAEREQLLKNVKMEFENVLLEQDEMDDTISELKK